LPSRSRQLQKLKKLADDQVNSERIFFVGMKIGDEKMQLYRSSRIFVFPSHSENFGNVVLEALMSYTPVIASKYTPWSEIREYDCGSWIDNTPQAIKIELESFLTLNDDEYINKAINGYHFVLEKFSITKNADKILKIFN
jgi:glycosyltransferase involved in cell wall biosynthesis